MSASSDVSPSASGIKTNKASNYYCCVPFCNSNGRYDLSLSFHHIPKDESLRKQWIIKIRRDEGPLFNISKTTVVCSKHFTKNDYTGWNPLKRRLKKDAFPSIFDWKEERTPRRTIKRKVLASPENKQCKRLQTQDPVTECCDTDVPYTETTIQGDSELAKLKEKLCRKTDECDSLNKQLASERFLVSRFSRDDKLILFYTGFPSYIIFLSFFECIEPSATNMQSKYYQSGETINLAGRKRNMLLIDELFMFLCRLRVGLIEQNLSGRFNCSVPTVGRKIVPWVNFLYIVRGIIPLWLPKTIINENMPDCFKELYPKTRVIIDCTEIKTQQPSSLVLNSQMYPNYKSACTFKCLLGIAPHGAVTFISALYTGCMSDIEITKLSGILDILEPGDDVMADKGFTLRKILAEKNVTLNIPPFLSSKKKFTKTEIKETEQIAKLRIHIERVNRRIKEFHLFDTPIPMSLTGSANQLWAVACMLSNFRGHIVQAWAKNAN